MGEPWEDTTRCAESNQTFVICWATLRLDVGEARFWTGQVMNFKRMADTGVL